MPWGDQSGPEGWGSMTGRGLGYCAGYNSPGFTKGTPRGGGGFGRGFGRGSGRGFRGGRSGRGFGYARAYPAYANYPAAPVRRVPVSRGSATVPYPQYVYSKEDEVADLKAEKQALENDLKMISETIQDVDKRLKELEKKK